VRHLFSFLHRIRPVSLSQELCNLIYELINNAGNGIFTYVASFRITKEDHDSVADVLVDGRTMIKGDRIASPGNAPGAPVIASPGSP